MTVPPGRALGTAQVPGLAEVLDDRESRESRRAELAAVWRGRPVSLVQLTISAPGARKNGADIDAAADFGARVWEQRARALGVPLLHRETRSGAAGPCRLWVADASPRDTKSLVIGLEDGCSIGRLWDFDVYDDGGNRVGREEVGSAPRRCFLCGENAAACAGRRVHELADVERRFNELLERGLLELRAKMGEHD